MTLLYVSIKFMWGGGQINSNGGGRRYFPAHYSPKMYIGKPQTYPNDLALCVSSECSIHRLFFLLFGIDSSMVFKFDLKNQIFVSYSHMCAIYVTLPKYIKPFLNIRAVIFRNVLLLSFVNVS